MKILSQENIIVDMVYRTYCQEYRSPSGLDKKFVCHKLRTLTINAYYFYVRTKAYFPGHVGLCPNNIQLLDNFSSPYKDFVTVKLVNMLLYTHTVTKFYRVAVKWITFQISLMAVLKNH